MVLGAVVHNATGARGGDVCQDGLCDPAHKKITLISRRGQPDNMGLNVDGFYREVIFHIRAKTPMRRPKHSKVCRLITSGIKGLCLGCGEDIK